MCVGMLWTAGWLYDGSSCISEWYNCNDSTSRPFSSAKPPCCLQSHHRIHVVFLFKRRHKKVDNNIVTTVSYTRIRSCLFTCGIITSDYYYPTSLQTSPDLNNKLNTYQVLCRKIPAAETDVICRCPSKLQYRAAIQWSVAANVSIIWSWRLDFFTLKPRYIVYEMNTVYTVFSSYRQLYTDKFKKKHVSVA